MKYLFQVYHDWQQKPVLNMLQFIFSTFINLFLFSNEFVSIRLVPVSHPAAANFRAPPLECLKNCVRAIIEIPSYL